MKPQNKKEAFNLLVKLNAPDHLITHVKLVGEAGELLIDACRSQGLNIDEEFVRVGIVIHDVGKTIHHNEMTGPGSEHEPDGQELLLKHGVSKKMARVCLSHARWASMECSIEELLIALSDKLWKGKRQEQLELKVIDSMAEKLGRDRWTIFQEMDVSFEQIAANGHDRLQRSVC